MTTTRTTVWLLFITLLLLAGCGGSGDDDTPLASNPLDGFTLGKGNPVSGIEYSSASYSGTTNQEGLYKYAIGQEMTFSIGGIVLGTVTARAQISPLDFDSKPVMDEKTNLTPSDKVINITRFLLTIDATRPGVLENIYNTDGNQNIAINETTIAAAAGLSVNFDQTPDAFAQDPQVINAVATISGAVHSRPMPLVGADYARWVLSRHIALRYGSPFDWTPYLAIEDGRRWNYSHVVSDGQGQITAGTASRYAHQVAFRNELWWVQGTSINGGNNEYIYYDKKTSDGIDLIAYQAATSNVDRIYSFPVELASPYLAKDKLIPNIVFLLGNAVHGTELTEIVPSLTVEGINYTNALRITFTSYDGTIGVTTWYVSGIGMVSQLITAGQQQTRLNLLNRDVTSDFPMDPLAERNISNILIRNYMKDQEGPNFRNVRDGFFLVGLISARLTASEYKDAFRAAYTLPMTTYHAGLASKISSISSTYRIDSDWVVGLLVSDYIEYTFEFLLIHGLAVQENVTPAGYFTVDLLDTMVIDMKNIYLTSIVNMVASGLLYDGADALFVVP